MVRHWCIFFAAIEEKSRFARQLSLCCKFYGIVVKYNKKGGTEMKKIISIILAFTLLFAFASCGNIYGTEPNIATTTETVVLGEIDYSKIKFRVDTGSPPYGTVSPQNREELIDYIVRHGDEWTACDYCDIYINFWSSSDIPAKDLFDIPFTGYKSYDDE